MKILLINNNSRFIHQLKDSISKNNELYITSFKDINLKKISAYDKIILSGGSLSVVDHRKNYLKEIGLIKKSRVPILGICLGFEIIAVGMGETLERLNSKERGIIKVTKIKNDPLMKNITHFNAFESHRWVLRKCKKLIPLAISKDGVEIIKHTHKKIYGVQFHPEMFHNKTYGMTLLNNFLLL